jgi:hypothetical protein
MPKWYGLQGLIIIITVKRLAASGSVFLHLRSLHADRRLSRAAAHLHINSPWLMLACSCHKQGISAPRSCSHQRPGQHQLTVLLANRHSCTSTLPFALEYCVAIMAPPTTAVLSTKVDRRTTRLTGYTLLVRVPSVAMVPPFSVAVPDDPGSRPLPVKVQATMLRDATSPA